MITAAKRLDLVSEYYFAGKLREIARMQAEGLPVLNLGIGSPDQPPHPDVIEALHSTSENARSHGYQSYTGIAALREAWANWYGRHYSVSLDPDGEVLPLIGSKEGIVHIAMAFLEPGDVALVPDPGYPAYRAASLLAGAEVRTYDLKAKGGWLPDLDSLESSDLAKVKVLWANYPHMPTGAPGSEQAFRDLVSFGVRHNILIVHDNPYSFILNETPRSILATEGAAEVAIELNSLSKSHNMAGWRVGALLGHSDYLKAVLRFKSNMDSGQFLAVQQAAVRALQLPGDWYAGLNDLYRKRRQVAEAIMEALGCRFDKAQQGMFLWAEIPERYRDAYALSDELLQEKHLFLTPGGIFGSNGDRFIRLSLCSTVEVLEQALSRIVQPLKNAKTPISDPVHQNIRTT
ncbi:MAG: aminotransferase class I/II-fold pyridoxal phosphate-dependent enzyme [Saprospiraceae bacterium]|nr:aminotransferase class I/II-fold pyridoxal phosphate-dependent enzyme [Saprospiraceae bacterium]